jgi:hypothetical protein
VAGDNPTARTSAPGDDTLQQQAGSQAHQAAGTKLEQLTPGALVSGVIVGGSVTVVDATWHGANALTLTYRDGTGTVAQSLLYRDREPSLSVRTAAGAYAFDGDPALFRLAAEALRIRMAARFDPMLAVTTSDLDPLPHQIKAVYGELLPRTPLRFLLADDPGAGKTIMAGLYIKELMLRGDLARCLVVAPGSLVEQWQEEPRDKFGLRFDLLTRSMIDAALDGSVFDQYPLLIARMDQLSRADDIKAQLEKTDWDLIVVDEAHRMSAHYFGAELKTTKRYELGRLLGRVTRHLLLMTATPHAGKEEDFQLFMALLDFHHQTRRQRHRPRPRSRPRSRRRPPSRNPRLHQHPRHRDHFYHPPPHRRCRQARTPHHPGRHYGVVSADKCSNTRSHSRIPDSGEVSG